MRLQDLALASARVAVANEKAADDLSLLLEKWFAKHLVKGIKLPTLKALYDTGAFGAFSERLAVLDEASVIAVLRRVDPFKADILARPRPAMEAHIRDLAAGRVEPVQRPKPAKKPKTPRGSSGKTAQTGGIYERSRF